MPDNIVEVQQLSRQFGSHTALDHVSLKVEKGYVYGLVGVNGAGKTTLIKHFLGLLRAKEGTVRVFGLDPATHPVEVLRRIGYLSEEREMPEWMSIHELMRYTAAFHPRWDHSYARGLLETFKLDGQKKVKHLSKGMRAQAGLIAAVSHRPDLLLLDEPSTGLDPVVRKDILNAIVRTVADENRTAIFSSHLLDEVEMMSDYVFMMHQGKLVLRGVLDDIKQQHQVMSIRFGNLAMELPSFEGVLTVERRGSSFHVITHGFAEQLAHQVAALGGEVLQHRGASLQEIFVARAGRELLVELN